MSIELDPNMPGIEEASKRLDAMIAEESAGTDQTEAGSAGSSAKDEPRAAQGGEAETQTPTDFTTDTRAAAEPAAATEQSKSPEQEQAKAADAPAKAQKELSRYAKSQERLTKTWEGVNAEKAALSGEKQKLEAERAALARKQAEFEAVRRQAETAHGPEDYSRSAVERRKLADHQRAEADRREDAGKFGEAEGLRKEAARSDAIADELDAHAENLRKNPPKGLAERQAQFEQTRKAWTMEAAKAHPELSQDGSPLQRQVAAMLDSLARTDPQLCALPSVIYHATTVAALRLEAQALKAEAARVPGMVKEVGELKARVKEMESATTPAGSTAAQRLGGSQAGDEEAELERMARELGTLR